MELSHLDHLVLTVDDVDHTVEFYQRVLGMKAIEFGAGRKALTFGNQKINLHQRGQEIEPKAQHVQVGSADLCFIIKGDIASAKLHIEAQGVALLDGPVMRTGAMGPIVSLYFRDPSGNLLEVSSYESSPYSSSTY